MKYRRDMIRSAISVTGLIFLQSCGPMNSRPGDAAGAVASSRCQSGAADAGDGAAVFATDQSRFVVSTQFANLQGDGTAQSPKTGTLMIRSVHGKGLDLVSKDTKIEITYQRESARESTHAPYPLAVTRTEDGNFSGPFTLKKTGTYDFHIVLTEGNSKDEHTVALKVQ